MPWQLLSRRIIQWIRCRSGQTLLSSAACSSMLAVARQLPYQCNAIMKALPIQGARLIDAWRTLPPRERQSVALILCMLGWGALYGQPKAAVRTAVTARSGMY